jgi:chalcone isomerase-like protein
MKLDLLWIGANGAIKGIIKGDDFAKAFFSIWLGADPPNPEIKSGLLGGACG